MKALLATLIRHQPWFSSRDDRCGTRSMQSNDEVSTAPKKMVIFFSLDLLAIISLVGAIFWLPSSSSDAAPYSGYIP